MIPYESMTSSSQTRGNGSAYETFGWNPAFTAGFQTGATGGIGQPLQQGPFTNNPFAQQQTPQFFQQAPQQFFQQQPQPFGFGNQLQQQQGQQPGFAQAGQPGFAHPSMFNPATAGFAQMPHFQQMPQLQAMWPQIAPYLQQWAGAQQQMHPQAFAGVGTPSVNVVTTRAVNINVTIPAQVLASRNPIEIQAYVLQVIVPTLLDALTKRALTQDPGRSVSFDVRNGCVAGVSV
jgi:hypothetical protein